MRRMVFVSFLSVLGAAFFAGCSSEQHSVHLHEREFCPTDAIAIFGQEVYYGRFTPCFSDGHQVPVPYPINHRDDELAVSADVTVR